VSHFSQQEPIKMMQREYASVLTRFGAILIDGLLILPFYIPIVLILRLSGGNLFDANDQWLFLYFATILAAAVFGFWNTIIRMGKTGQSLGRKFLHIAVLRNDGQPLGVGRAFLREVIGRWISSIVCYIGYLNAFWDKNRQMWHDKIADCYVYNVEDNFS
jgi:uncharacterized RDD family membrane protein YckC